MNLYAFYENGKLIAKGTIRQIAEATNYKEATIRNWKTNKFFFQKKIKYIGREEIKYKNKFIRDSKLYALYKRRKIC